jgi:hypothetical protein
MSTRIREGLHSAVSSFGKNNFGFSGGSSNITGKIYGIVTTKNTPTKKQYERANGMMGTIFYLEYNQSQNITGSNIDSFLDTCTPALPVTYNQDYPILGELVKIYNLPAPISQKSPNGFTSYYGDIVNLYNDPQNNSTAVSNNLGQTFEENNNILPLQQFEGDVTLEGRKGQGIRFGSTVSKRSNINEWSSIGNNGDPITILVNGYVTSSADDQFVIEEVNKNQSSIYLTSTQAIPLVPGASIVNPRANTIKPSSYNSSQLIFNSDRITLNSKKDEVLVFAKTNIELNSDNIININAGQVAHINSPAIALGTKMNGKYPTEPVLLGNQMSKTFDILIETLSNLASSLICASTQDGSIVACSEAGAQLFADLKRLNDQIEKCYSSKVYTI